MRHAAADGHPDHKPQQQPSVSPARRALLLSLLSLPASAALLLTPGSRVLTAVAAEPTPLTSEELKKSVFANSFVLPAMDVPSYLRRLSAARPAAWQLFDDLIEVGRYKDLADDLTLSPFDDVKQSCFYIPHAMLGIKGAADQAVAAQLSYLSFADQVRALRDAALAAERGQRDEQDVRAAVDALAASLDSFLGVVAGVV